MTDNSNDKTEKDSEAKPIKFKQSKLEKTLKLSSNEILAEAIRDLLNRDKI